MAAWTVPDLDVESLEAALAGTLPGPVAHLRMAPRPRVGWRPGIIPDDCRHAAALLLVYPEPPECLLLTRRRADLTDHAGQVSLPGGEIEPGENRVEAACREAHEEVGLDPGLARILGPLSPLHVPVSRFVLHPIVAVAGEYPELRPSDAEVDRVLEPPLERLLDPRHQRVEIWRRDGAQMRVPLFDVCGEKVWGATAMVLSEFLTLVGSPPSPWPDDRSG